MIKKQINLRKSAYFAIMYNCKLVLINNQKKYNKFIATPYFVKIWIKRLLCLLFFIISLYINAQKEQLAQNYFDRGEFEKALISFQDLAKDQPNNGLYFQKSIECLQQLKQFDKAQTQLTERYDRYKQPTLLVEIGFNYQLQKNALQAKKYFDLAIAKIKTNADEVYGIGQVFEQKALVDYALLAYQTTMALNPKYAFNYQVALLYGQKGDVEKMIEMLLNESYQNQINAVRIQNNLSRFMAEDKTFTFTETLKKALLIRIQKTQDVFWNQYLSWYYVQMKEYGKAFVQEKAIYKRNPESFNTIVGLGEMAMDEKNTETAVEILNFVLQNTKDLDLQIQANAYLMDAKIATALSKDYPTINQELDLLIKQFGATPYSLSLLKLKAHFAAFKLKDAEQAKQILKNALEMPINSVQTAEIKMELADVFLYEEKFNQALLYYSQIQEDGNNSIIAQEASLKIAKTSYFKADFEWATHQLKILKSASTQLIANDAMDLFLLINDNTVEDSTQVALKKFAKADYLLFQDKKQDALQAFKAILHEFKGKEIEPVTLLRLGKMYETQADFTQALFYYQQILDNFKECIYVDEALFFSAEIYNQQNNFEKAKPLYEALLFKHEDSIYFVQGQQKYRKLRGDTNL